MDRHPVARPVHESGSATIIAGCPRSPRRPSPSIAPPSAQRCIRAGEVVLLEAGLVGCHAAQRVRARGPRAIELLRLLRHEGRPARRDRDRCDRAMGRRDRAELSGSSRARRASGLRRRHDGDDRRREARDRGRPARGEPGPQPMEDLMTLHDVLLRPRRARCSAISASSRPVRPSRSSRASSARASGWSRVGMDHRAVAEDVYLLRRRLVR